MFSVEQSEQKSEPKTSFELFTSLNNKLSAKTRSISHLELQLKEHEKELSSVCNLYENAKSSLQRYQKQESDLNTQNLSLHKKVSELEIKLKSKMELLDAEREKIDKLSDQLIDHQEILQVKEQKVTEIEGKVIRMKDQLQQLLSEETQVITKMSIQTQTIKHYETSKSYTSLENELYEKPLSISLQQQLKEHETSMPTACDSEKEKVLLCEFVGNNEDSVVLKTSSRDHRVSSESQKYTETNGTALKQVYILETENTSLKAYIASLENQLDAQSISLNAEKRRNSTLNSQLADFEDLKGGWSHSKDHLAPFYKHDMLQKKTQELEANLIPQATGNEQQAKLEDQLALSNKQRDKLQHIIQELKGKLNEQYRFSNEQGDKLQNVIQELESKLKKQQTTGEKQQAKLQDQLVMSNDKKDKLQNTILELKRNFDDQIGSSNEQRNKLQNMIQELESKLKKQQAKLEDQLTSSNEQNDKLRNVIQELESKLKRQQTTGEKQQVMLQDQLVMSNDKKDKLQNSILELKRNFDDQIGSSNEQRNKLQNMIQELESKLKEQQAKLEDQLTSSSEQNDKLQNVIEELKQKLDEQFRSSNEQGDKLQNVIQELESKLKEQQTTGKKQQANLQDQLVMSIEQNDELQYMIREHEGKLDDQIASSNEERDKLQDMVQELESKLKKQQTTEKEQQAKLEDQLALYNEQRDKLQNMIQELEGKLDDQIGSSNKETDMLQNVIEELKIKLEKQQPVLDKQKAKLEEQQSRLEEQKSVLNEKEAKLEGEQTVLEAQQSVLAKQQAKLLVEQTLFPKESLTIIQKQSEERETLIASLQEEIEALVVSLAEKSRRCIHLEKKLNKANNQHVSFSASHTEKSEEIEKLKNDILIQDVAIAKLENSNREFQDKAQALVVEQTCQKLAHSVEIEMLNNQVDAVTKQLSHSKELFNEKNKDCRNAEDLYSTLLNKVPLLEQQIAAMKAESIEKKLIRRSSSQTSNLTQMQSREKSMYEDTIQELKNQISSKNQNINQLEIACAKSQEKIFGLESVLQNMLAKDSEPIRSADKPATLSYTLSSVPQECRKAVRLQELVSQLSQYLNVSPDSAIKFITNLSNSGSLGAELDVDDHEKIAILKKEKAALLEQVKENKEVVVEYQDKVQLLLLTVEAFETKDSKLYDAAIKIAEESVPMSLTNEEIRQRNILNVLSREKWKLLQSILRYQKELCKAHPASLEKQISFTNRVEQLYSQIKTFSLPEPQNDSAIFHQLTLNKVCPYHEQFLHLQLDMEFLISTKVLYKHFVIPLLKNIKDDRSFARTISKLSENASKKFDIQNWGSVELSRGLCGNQCEATASAFKQFSNEMRFEREVSSLSRENTSLRRENDSLRSELEECKKTTLPLQSFHLLSSSSAQKQSFSDFKKILGEHGLSIIDAPDKESMESAESRESVSSENFKYPHDKEGKVHSSVNYQNADDRIHRLSVNDELMQVPRPQYSSPDLGIESDPSQDHMAAVLAENSKSTSHWKSHKLSTLVSREGEFECKTSAIPSAFTVLEDFELLKQEVQECLIAMKSIDSRANNGLHIFSRDGTPKKSFECSTLKGILDSCRTAEVCLLRSQQIMNGFEIEMLPRNEGDKSRVTKLQVENDGLRGALKYQKDKMEKQHLYFMDATIRLQDIKKKKDESQKQVTKTLVKTKKVLREVKGRLMTDLQQPTNKLPLENQDH